MSELLFVTDEVRLRYIRLMEQHGIPREFWGVGGENTPTHCSCGRPWVKHHSWARSPNVCFACDKLRPIFNGERVFDPKNPEDAEPGEWETKG